MRRFTPVRFTDVSIEGAFWKERLDTVPHHLRVPGAAHRRGRAAQLGGELVADLALEQRAEPDELAA